MSLRASSPAPSGNLARNSCPASPGTHEALKESGAHSELGKDCVFSGDPHGPCRRGSGCCREFTLTVQKWTDSCAAYFYTLTGLSGTALSKATAGAGRPRIAKPKDEVPARGEPSCNNRLPILEGSALVSRRPGTSTCTGALSGMTILRESGI